MYEHLLDQNPDRVEMIGRIVQHKFSMFKSESVIPGDRSNIAAVSAAQGNWVSLSRLDVNNNNNKLFIFLKYLLYQVYKKYNNKILTK